MSNSESQFICATGLASGEETKGVAVKWLAREFSAHTVWRRGGWQSGHLDTTEDGREQMFSHFGSGTFDLVPTYLNDMVISPVDLYREAIEIESKGVPDPFRLLTIDANCLVTTPYHSAISRYREILRGADRKGTVGKGVGDAIKDSSNPELSIRAGEFVLGQDFLCTKVEAIRQHKLTQAKSLFIASGLSELPESALIELRILQDRGLVGSTSESFEYLADLVPIVGDSYLKDLLGCPGAIVCESSHGILLHPWYGYLPYVTQVDPTPTEVINSLNKFNYPGRLVHLGVSRCYLTRHGGVGPFVSYSPELTKDIVETHNNVANDWFGEFQNGVYDIVALKYSLQVANLTKPIDGLMISYMDVLNKKSAWPVCEAYTYTGNFSHPEEYFQIQDNQVIGIKLHPDTGESSHYQYQLQLTRLLKDCRPILRSLQPNADKSLSQVFLDYVEDKLDLPVVAVGLGPKASDRYFTSKTNRAKILGI